MTVCSYLSDVCVSRKVEECPELSGYICAFHSASLTTLEQAFAIDVVNFRVSKDETAYSLKSVVLLVHVSYRCHMLSNSDSLVINHISKYIAQPPCCYFTFKDMPQ
jgi:hypothetical protein